MHSKVLFRGFVQVKNGTAFVWLFSFFLLNKEKGRIPDVHCTVRWLRCTLRIQCLKYVPPLNVFRQLSNSIGLKVDTLLSQIGPRSASGRLVIWRPWHLAGLTERPNVWKLGIAIQYKQNLVHIWAASGTALEHSVASDAESIDFHGQSQRWAAAAALWWAPT